MPTTIPRTARPAASVRIGRLMMQAVAYVTAAVLGLSVGPILFMVSDRATALHWANYVLDLVSGR